MVIRALHHIQLAMPAGQEDQARAFYSGTLGFRELPKPEHLARRGGVWFSSGSAEVHLGVEPDFRPARKAHPAFLVDDLQEVIARCLEGGYRVTRDEPLAGFDRIYVADPFGNRIEILEPKGDV
jgi:catechol 2,3-dioxygenase-like lactoylglutathione lyase family enzyme